MMTAHELRAAYTGEPDRACRSRSSIGDRTRKALTIVALVGGMTFVFFPPALAQTPGQPLSVPIGELAGSSFEAFTLPGAVRSTLRGQGFGVELEIAAFPVEPGVRRALRLTRFDPYAPKARIFVVDDDGTVEAARTTRVFFLGTSPDDSSLRIGLSVDADRGTVRGLVMSSAGTFEIMEPNNDRSRHRIRRPATAPTSEEQKLQASCGTDELPVLTESLQSLSSPSISISTEASPPARQAVVAVDTDSTFNQKKFGDDTTAATEWIADLFLQMNVLYERDLDLGLVQGDLFLRVGSDPYSQNTSGASGAHLNEFGNYWAAYMGSVDRVFAMLLSGNSSSGFSSSGIAWLDGYCEYQNAGGGYSVTQVFTANVSVLNDVRIVGHELGHNFGSPHTHCYVPPVDTCYGSESGCYSGAGGLSCPPGGKGTLMSYCHFFSGANCGSNLAEFHPTVIAYINLFVDAHYPGCVTPYEPPDQIFSDGFESGNVDLWSGSTPP